MRARWGLRLQYNAGGCTLSQGRWDWTGKLSTAMQKMQVPRQPRNSWPHKPDLMETWICFNNWDDIKNPQYVHQRIICCPMVSPFQKMLLTLIWTWHLFHDGCFCFYLVFYFCSSFLLFNSNLTYKFLEKFWLILSHQIIPLRECSSGRPPYSSLQHLTANWFSWVKCLPFWFTVARRCSPPE